MRAARSLPIVALALAACAPIPSTQVIVHLLAEPELRPRAARLHVVVESQEGEIVLEREKPLEGTELQLARIPVIPRDGDASRFFLVRAELYGEGDAPIGRIEATVRFREDELADARLVFEVACEGASDCGAGRTCVGGLCVGGCFDATPLEPVQLARSRCGTCERCAAGSCEPIADGAACGCEGDACVSGACVVAQPARSVIAGSAHSCAVTDDADVSCWGANDEGQLGLGTIDDPALAAAPASVDLGGSVDFIQRLAGGDGTTCALRGNSSWTCWGANWFGQFGSGEVGRTGTPTTMAGPELVDLSGSSHFCGITRDGALWCWGYNERGQLGRGVETRNESTPVRVGERSDWRALDADGLHTCAIRLDDTLWCWGYNDSGELGLGDAANRALPERPGCAPAQSGTCWDDWAAVTNGEFHTCGLRRDRSLWCWGGNGNGQLGVGVIGTEESAPRRVGESRWFLVEAGERNTCAIAEDGSLWCWGPGSAGQIGDGARETRSVPSRVLDPPSGSRWEQIAIGAEHTCGVRSDRSVWCWGANAEGQLGIGAATDAGVPVPRRVCLPVPGP